MIAGEHTRALDLLRRSQCILSTAEVDAAVERVASSLNQTLRDSGEIPLALVLMRGGLIFAGHLLTQLDFPLEIGYVDVSRYGSNTRGGELHWRVDAFENVKGRTVLLIDDILDAGLTLAAVRERLVKEGAQRVLIAVFVDKQNGLVKPVQADFCGAAVPDCYVFGFGMDVHGLWRNLPAVYALPAQDHDS